MRVENGGGLAVGDGDDVEERTAAPLLWVRGHALELLAILLHCPVVAAEARAAAAPGGGLAVGGGDDVEGIAAAPLFRVRGHALELLARCRRNSINQCVSFGYDTPGF